MWLTVPGGFRFESMAGEPGGGLSGANDDDSVLVAVVGWRGDVGERAGGPCRGHGTECGRRQLRESRVRSGLTRPVVQGLGRAEGGRAVVTVCDEPPARGGGAVARGLARSGLVRIGVPAGISRWSGLLVVGWRAATLSRSCHP